MNQDPYATLYSLSPIGIRDKLKLLYFIYVSCVEAAVGIVATTTTITAEEVGHSSCHIVI